MIHQTGNSKLLFQLAVRHLIGLLLVLPMLVSSFAYAENPKSVLLVFDPENSHQLRLLDMLQTLSRQSDPSTLQFKSSSYQSFAQQPEQALSADLVISLGSASSEAVIPYHTTKPVLHALITHAQARQLFPCLPDCDEAFPNHGMLVLDQPVARQLLLTSLVDPEARRIGILAHSVSDQQRSELHQVSQAHGLEIDFEITAPRLLGSHIESLARRVDVLLALADPEVYNPSTIPQILLTTYRHRVPVVGFSKGFVRAGAIASVVTSLEQFAQQIFEMVQASSNNQLHNIGLIEPAYFEVVTNRDVARSLHLRFTEDIHLQSMIKKHELAD